MCLGEDVAQSGRFRRAGEEGQTRCAGGKPAEQFVAYATANHV
jgi:hypothetical protein